MNASDLASAIDLYFNLDELEKLCFSPLGIDYQNIPGDTKEKKARELVGYYKRRNGIPELIQALQQARPSVVWDWDDTPAAPPIRNDQNHVQYSTHVLYQPEASGPRPQIDLADKNDLRSRSSEATSEASSHVIEEIVRYVMSKHQHQYNPNWFVSRRERMETSYAAIASATNHIELLVRAPDIATETIESCRQLSMQAVNLLQLLEQMGIGPNSSGSRRDLHNNLFLVDERARKAVEKIERVVNSFYSIDSPEDSPAELRLHLQGLQAPTTYTLSWLNRTIERLDQLAPQ